MCADVIYANVRNRRRKNKIFTIIIRETLHNNRSCRNVFPFYYSGGTKKNFVRETENLRRSI